MKSSMRTLLTRLSLVCVAYAGIGAIPIAVQAQPIGDEFQVNSTTVNHQRAPDVATDDQGNFVIVFQNWLAGTGANVAAQRYRSTGERLGGEFQINTTANSDLTLPAIAMTPDGDFVVVWQDFGDDGSGFGIFAQRYSSDGQAQGPNIPVNTTVDDAQRRSDVAMSGNGNFVVVWEDDTVGNNKRGIRGQRFDALGSPQGSEFDISTDPDIDHTYPKVAMDTLGNFVVGWSAGTVGANQDVVFRRFDLNGLPLGQSVQVNVTSKMDSASGVVNNMSIDSDNLGNFVVAWRADNFSGPGISGLAVGILARRYDKDGNPLGAPFEVHTDQASFTGAPEVVVLPDGEFAIAYEATDDSLTGIFERVYSSSGQPIGPAAQLNTTTDLIQDRPAVALNGAGGGVVTWRATRDQDGDRDGIFARMFAYDDGMSSENRVLKAVCAVENVCSK